MSFVYLRKHIRENWNLITLLSGFYILGGFLALTFAGIPKFASIALLGLCLAIVGVVEIYFAVKTQRESGSWYHFLFGGLGIACGAAMFIPAVPIPWIYTLAAAVYLSVRAVVQLAGSALIRYPLWGWTFVNGAISAVLAGAVIYLWPVSSIWLIGNLVGIPLLLFGAEFMGLAAVARRVPHAHHMYPTGASADPHLNTKSVKDSTKPSDPDIEKFY